MQFNPEPFIIRTDLNHGIGKFSSRDLCDSLCLFVDEICRMDSKDFPPNTIKGIIFNIQMFLRKRRIGWKLFDPVQFMDLRNTVDNIMKERTKQGLAKKTQSEIISFAVEELLWVKQVLGDENPEQLLHTVLFLLGLCCALRGGSEHWNLCRPGCSSQFSIVKDEQGIEVLRYDEDPLQKSNQGGLNDNNPGSGKQVYVYPSPNVARDPVRIYKKYISLMPSSLSCKSFYLRPLRKPTSDCWYGDQPYGQKKTSQVVKSIMENAKISGRYTNHSLRRTAATRLLQAKVEEKIVKEITGHKSDCVRMYQHTSDNLKRDACMSLYGLNPKHYVECEVTKPVAPTGDQCNSESENKDQNIADPTENVQGAGGVIPIITDENYPNGNQHSTHKVRCLSNHRGSKDVVRICELLQKKVDDNTRITSNYSPKIFAEVGIQTDLPCDCKNNSSDTISVQCECKSKTFENASVQTDQKEYQTKHVSFDINFNWST